MPDIPRFVEIRSMLIGGDSTLVGQPDGGLIVSGDGSLAGVVGRPTADDLETALAVLGPGSELLVPGESIDWIRGALPGTVPQKALIHRLGAVLPQPDLQDVEIGEVDSAFLARLPDELVAEVDGAVMAAVRRVAGGSVAVCSAWWLTESHWDVGVDTLPGHRRRGHARACFLALADHMMKERSLEPVWGALADNTASLRMAASLGFVQDGELWVVEI